MNAAKKISPLENTAESSNLIHNNPVNHSGPREHYNTYHYFALKVVAREQKDASVFVVFKVSSAFETSLGLQYFAVPS
jgi:hypothetical protein